MGFLNIMNYTETIQIIEKALDKLTIKDFLEQSLGDELTEIMKNLEESLEYEFSQGNGKEVYEYMKQYPEIFGNPPELFNYMDEYEFLEYCQKKFPEIYWGHEIVEKYWISGIKENATTG